MKKVSLIMPIYNAERYLKNTLNNVLSQTYPNIELIVVDDCSTDSTSKILTEYNRHFFERGYSYIVVNRRVNGGLCAAINSGLEKASGSFLCFPDADDEILPNYTLSMVNILEREPRKGWARCDYTIILEDEDRSYNMYLPHRSVYKNDFFDFISKFIAHNAWNMMVRREYFEECIGKQILDSRLTQEWSLLLPLSFYSDYARTHEISYRYHIRKTAMSSWQNRDVLSVIAHYEQLRELNFAILKLMKIPENDIYVCTKALDMYYTFAKFKTYRSRNCILEMKQERLKLQTYIKDNTSFTDDPEFAVRLSMDELLSMRKKNPCELFDQYKKMFADGYMVFTDNQGGGRLLSTLYKAFGKPNSIVKIGDQNYKQHDKQPVACLIENSDTYNKIIERSKKPRGLFIDYRCLRDALRGWAYYERGRN